MTSIVIKQFLALCRGEIQVKKPQMHAKITRLEPVQGLCLKCNVLSTHDYLHFQDDTRWLICQVCSHVVVNGAPTHQVMLADGMLHRIEEL